MNFEEISTIAPGGAVFQININKAGHQWLASPTGLLRYQDGDWQMLMRGVPFWRVNSVASAGSALFLAGMPNGIIRSFDYGDSWNKTFIDQVNAPVVKILPAPNYEQSKTVFAITVGDGVLRSTNGGRHWQLSNFGLREFEMIDLVAAPWWDERYEYLFACSETAVYQSPNGGRAWRRGTCDDELHPVALAVSPNFAQDKTVYLGTEDGRIYRSTDAGRSWQPMMTGFDTITAFCFVEDRLLVGTFDGVIAVSISEPIAKTPIFQSRFPVLSITQYENKIYATLADGVVVSDDNGRSWQSIPPYAARRFVWLKPLGDALIAAGPEEGVWLSTDNGRSWQLIWADGVVLALHATAEQIIVSSDEGVFLSDDQGKSWKRPFALDNSFTAMATTANGLLFSTPQSELYTLAQGELTPTNPPFSGQHLLDFYTEAERLFAATWHSDTGELQLWEQQDAQWQLCFSERSQPIKPSLLIDDAVGLLIGLGANLYHLHAGAWQKIAVTTTDAPVTAVSNTTDYLLVGATNQLLQIDKHTLTIEPLVWQESPIAAIYDQMILTVNGRFLKWLN